MRTVPVNQSAGPLPEGCEPARIDLHQQVLDLVRDGQSWDQLYQSSSW
jgi:hypothetical protein